MRTVRRPSPSQTERRGAKITAERANGTVSMSDARAIINTGDEDEKEKGENEDDNSTS